MYRPSKCHTLIFGVSSTTKTLSTQWSYSSIWKHLATVSMWDSVEKFHLNGSTVDISWSTVLRRRNGWNNMTLICNQRSLVHGGDVDCRTLLRHCTLIDICLCMSVLMHFPCFNLSDGSLGVAALVALGKLFWSFMRKKCN